MRYRSRRTIEAYYRDGTPEADSAIIQAVDRAELLTDALGVTHLMVPASLMGGNTKMPVGYWIYREFGAWSLRIDTMFRLNYEVPEKASDQ